jgi:hypothetical protein
LNQYREDYTEALSEDLDKSYRRKKYDAAQQEYYKAFDYIYQHEVQLIMAEATEEECEGKITFILQSIPVEGEKNERGGWNFDSMKRFKAYLIWSQHYNSLCNNILTLAINRKNQKLARFILMQFVEDDFEDGEYKSIERNKAEQKYQEAVNLGMFED